MNLHPTPSLGTAPASLLPGVGAETGPAGTGFADLLVERQAARAADGARAGQRSAFDVAPAPRPEARANAPAREREPAPRAAQERDARPAPRDGAARTEKPAGRSERRDELRPTTRHERAAEPSARSRPVDTPAEADEAHRDPLEAIRAQAVIDWFARLEAGAPPTPVAAPQALGATAVMVVPAGAGAGGDAAAAPADTLVGDAEPLSGARRASAALPTATPEEAANAAPAAAAFAEALPAVEAAAALDASRPPVDAPPATLPLPHPAAPVATVPAPGGASASAVGGTAAPLQLSAPVGGPDFSQALASQLTTLARDGVQEATLQLNPAEMGPIAVKIVLDGAQAQIDFTAAHARTREAIEAGLPSLAAALHGAGLTLAGGGVFEQRPGRDGEAASGDGGYDGAAPDADERLPAAAPRAVAVRGLLDAYA